MAVTTAYTKNLTVPVDRVDPTGSTDWSQVGWSCAAGALQGAIVGGIVSGGLAALGSATAGCLTAGGLDILRQDDPANATYQALEALANGKDLVDIGTGIFDEAAGLLG